MKNRIGLNGSIIIAVACLLGPATLAQAVTSGECYPDAPNVLLDEARKSADEIVNRGDATLVGKVWNHVVVYAVADAIAPDETHSLAAYQYLGETARTDKQLGASASSEGSTSAVEKPGFVQLLGVAIENGAIQKQRSGTSLTLTSSPYLLAFGIANDTAENYQKYDILNHIGFATTFNVSNQSSDLANVNTEQLTEWSVRLRFGDHSPRSKDFQDFWERVVQPRIHDRLRALGKGDHEVDRDPALTDLADNLQGDVTSRISARLKEHADDKPGVADTIVCYAKASIVDRIRNNDLRVRAATRDAIANDVLPALATAQRELENVRGEVNAALEALNDKPLATLEYTNHRTTLSSDYSEIKLLFEENVWRPLKLVTNAGVSVYQSPNRTMNQETFRGGSASISLEAKTDSPFLKNTPDLSKLTFAFTGRYERLQENAGVTGKKADIGVAQFKLEIPIALGLTLPLSVTYANSTELIKESKIRGNFGFTLDTDKLYVLAGNFLTTRR